MTIYRNKNNKLLYTLYHLVRNIRFADNGESCGIYAEPYNHNSETLIHTKSSAYFSCIEFNIEKYISNNFEIVTEL